MSGNIISSNIGAELAKTRTGSSFKDKYYNLMSNQYWRLNNLYKIVTKKAQSVQFRMNEPQNHFYRNMWYFNIIPKGRQLGFTTLIDLMGLDYALFNDNVTVIIIAHKREDVEDIFQDKIVYPYERLPEEILKVRPTTKLSKREIKFNNNSRIVVSLSGRSKTINFLHVSEFAKICLERPDRAEEIIVGSLPAVSSGNMAFIESTSEGEGGTFADWCNEAYNRDLRFIKPNERQFKLNFYPWYLSETNRLDSSTVTIYPALYNYFEELENKHGVILDSEQKAWYANEQELYGEKMKHENPSIFEECFSKTIEGAYYKSQFVKMRREKRITNVPHDPSYSVDTYWDIGHDDDTVIWFAQKVGKEIHFIDYYENSGETMDHYVKKVREMGLENGWHYGRHIAPHDIENVDFSASNNDTRWDIAARMGIQFETVEKGVLADGIEATRQMLNSTWFDEKRCKIGYEKVEEYKKDWDKRHNIWKSTPKKSPNNHAADALRMAGCTWRDIHTPVSSKPYRKKRKQITPASWT